MPKAGANDTALARDCRIIRQAVVAMRDGVPLVATIFLPKDEGRYPVVLQRTPYNRAGWVDGAEQFAKAGYVFISQDVRGRYDSGGECDFFIQEANDTPDTVAWIRHQPWCNGKVGMMGPSYLGWVQLYGVARGAGGEMPDALLPSFVSGDAWERGFYNSGPITLFLTYGLCFEFGSRIGGSTAMRYFDMAELSRHLPLRTMDVACGGGEFSLWRAFMDHPAYDEFWQRYSIHGNYDRFTMPALLVGGWYDYYPAQTIAQWKNMVTAARTKQIAEGHKLLIGPWGASSWSRTDQRWPARRRFWPAIHFQLNKNLSGMVRPRAEGNAAGRWTWRAPDSVVRHGPQCLA